MSTANFKLRNASRYFVFGTPVYYTAEDVQEMGLDEDIIDHYDADSTDANYDADKFNVLSELRKKGWSAAEGSDNSRAWTFTHIAKKSVTFNVGNDSEVTVTVTAGCASGYYSGANFDWTADIHFSGCMEGYYETFDYDHDEFSVLDIAVDNWYSNRGMSQIQADRLYGKIEKAIQELSHEAELAFSMYCDDEYHCSGVFSNGEATYSKNSKRLWQIEQDNAKQSA